MMLSCVSDTRKVVQAMRLGAQDYLTKPFQKAELDAVIDLCLGQGKHRLRRRSGRTLRGRILHCGQSCDAQDSFAGRAGRQRRHPGPPARRKRHRQGSSWTADSQAFTRALIAPF